MNCILFRISQLVIQRCTHLERGSYPLVEETLLHKGTSRFRRNEILDTPQAGGKEKTRALWPSDFYRLNIPSEVPQKWCSAHQESLCG